MVNIRRPLAGTVDKIIDLQQQMEIHSHLKITGMINNTNLATMTTPAELRDGYEMLREVSDRTGVPVMYTTGKKEMLDIFLAEGHDPKYIGKPVPDRHHHEARLGQLYPQLVGEETGVTRACGLHRQFRKTEQKEVAKMVKVTINENL